MPRGLPETPDRPVRIDLKPRQLALLVALDDYRNVARVADHVHVTQPAVSKSLAEIERQLDAPLFDRGPRGLTPTPYGACVVRHARQLLSGFREMRDELLALRSGGTGTVCVAMLPAAATTLVPRAVLRLKARAPATTVLLREGTLGEMLVELRGERVDLIVGTVPPAGIEGALQRQQLLAADPLVCVVGPHHPLAAEAQPQWEAVVRYPWIVPPPSASIRMPLEDWLAERELAVPLDRIESVSFTANLLLLQESQAVAFFTRSNAEHYRALGLVTVLPLPLPDIAGPVAALWLKNKPMTPPLRGMLDALADEAASR